MNYCQKKNIWIHTLIRSLIDNSASTQIINVTAKIKYLKFKKKNKKILFGNIHENVRLHLHCLDDSEIRRILRFSRKEEGLTFKIWRTQSKSLIWKWKCFFFSIFHGTHPCKFGCAFKTNTTWQVEKRMYANCVFFSSLIWDSN
jgi:hypothetical protein